MIRSFQKTVRRAAAFTLVEVMFAVITLGIGLILVAAMFPVAIQQTKLTGEESNAAELARVGIATMSQVAQSPVIIGSQSVSLFPPTAPATATTYYRGVVVPLRETYQIDPRLGSSASCLTWGAVRGNLISPSDARFAWVPLYRRDGIFGTPATWSSTAQIILIPVKVRNSSIFTSSDVAIPTSGTKLTQPYTNGTAAYAANLEPKYIQITQLVPSTATTNADTITFSASSGTQNVATEGAFVVIANDNLPGVNQGWLNGRVYRLGSQTDTVGTWNLAPGFDYSGDKGADGSTAIGTISTSMDAYIVGPGFDAPAAPAAVGGGAMDIAAYEGFVATN